MGEESLDELRDLDLGMEKIFMLMKSGGRRQKAGWRLYLDQQGYVWVNRVATQLNRVRELQGDCKKRMGASQISGDLEQ